MKKFIATLTVAVSATFFLVACGGGDAPGSTGNGGPPLIVDANGESSFDSTALGAALAALPVEDLNQAEQDSLAYMREEEKLAHDVYVLFDGIYGGSAKIFGNIAISETTHTEGVRQLLLRYNLPDPAATLAVGLFNNTTLQGLYTQLVATGSPSLIDALKVGVTIEELDMLDIAAHLAIVDNQDIRLVYDSLLKGSRNHLRSFVKNLLAQGGTYTPQYLTQAEFDAIVNTEMER